MKVADPKQSIGCLSQVVETMLLSVFVYLNEANQWQEWNVSVLLSLTIAAHRVRALHGRRPEAAHPRDARRDATGGCDAAERAEAAQTPSNRHASICMVSHDEREEQR